MKTILLFLAAAYFSLALRASDIVSKPLHPELEKFRPVLGTVWKGEMAKSTPEKPVFDVVSYERILNGQAIRSLHSINDGAYGGETIVRWDSGKKSLVYDYFTTAGFSTRGTMTLEDGVFTSYEEVEGAEAGGVSAVRAEGRFSESEIVVKSEYLKDGSWIPGHTATYRPAPDAEVRFK